MGVAALAAFYCRARSDKQPHAAEESHRGYSRRPSSRSLKLDAKKANGDMQMRANPMIDPADDRRVPHGQHA